MNHCTKLFILIVLVASFVGCRQPVTNNGPLLGFNPPNLFGGSSPAFMAKRQQPMQIQTQTQQEYQAYANLSSQLNNLNQRVGAFDTDNQQLHTEVASLKQKLQLANEYNTQLKQQLADTAGQYQQIQREKVSIEQQYAANQAQMQQLSEQARYQNGQYLQQQQQFQNQQQQFSQVSSSGTPSQFAGSATIRANNSMLARLNEINIPGGEARMDGDVIRIEFPSDAMFVPGTYQIQPGQTPLLQNLVTTIRQSFPRQIIGIESHWDKTPLNPPGTTDHQLTATQALSVFNNLSRLGLPPDQLFTMAMGSNRLRYPQANRGSISPNRRIEIVIYPETFDGS